MTAADRPGSPERRLRLLCEVFLPLHRLSPGSAATTRTALARTLAGRPPLPAGAVVVDMGCGRGASALVLAGALADVAGLRVVALDLYPPFVAAVADAAAEAGLAGRVLAVAADIAAPPLADGSAELIWAEGSVYAVGFAAGLGAWRRLLKAGGAVVASDLVWTTATPPEPARAFFAAEYPAMATAEARVAALRAAGFEALPPLIQPRSDWQAYYQPLAARLDGFRAEHPDDPDAAAVADDLAREIAVWELYGDSFGYAVLIGLKAPADPSV